MSHVEPGTATRSSGPACPQTKRIGPAGSQAASACRASASGMASRQATVTADSILMAFLTAAAASLYRRVQTTEHLGIHAGRWHSGVDMRVHRLLSSSSCRRAVAWR
jgi:hypothetical protein